MKQSLLINQNQYQTMSNKIQSEINDYLTNIINEELLFVENDSYEIINFWKQLKLFNNDSYLILIKQIENSINDFITYEINKQSLNSEIIDYLMKFITEQSLLINYEYEFRKSLLEDRLLMNIHNYINIYIEQSKNLYN